MTEITRVIIIDEKFLRKHGFSEFFIKYTFQEGLHGLDVETFVQRLMASGFTKASKSYQRLKLVLNQNDK